MNLTLLNFRKYLLTLLSSTCFVQSKPKPDIKEISSKQYDIES
jgi:hypothetical protein